MTRLFSRQIPNITISRTADSELDVLKKQFNEYDEYYVVSAAIKERRESFERMWNKYEPFADDDFISQAQKKFHPRVWEMYLGSVFMEKDFTLEKAGKNAPDLKIVSTGKPATWVECVAPEKGEKSDRVPSMLYGVVQDVPHEQILLRIASGFDVKSKKFLKYIADGTVGVNDPRIIAINRADLGYVDGDPPLIINVLFGLGHLTLQFDKEHKKVINTFYQQKENVIKKQGAEVGLRQFSSDNHKHISAVIYTEHHALNYFENIGADCMVVYNPFAEVPLPEDYFPFMESFVGRGNKVHKIAPKQKI